MRSNSKSATKTRITSSRLAATIAALLAVTVLMGAGDRADVAKPVDPPDIGKLVDIERIVEGVRDGATGSKEMAHARMEELERASASLRVIAIDHADAALLADLSEKALSAANRLSEVLGGDRPQHRRGLERNARFRHVAGRWEIESDRPMQRVGGGSQIGAAVNGLDTEIIDLDVLTSLDEIPVGSIVTLSAPSGTTINLSGARAADGRVLWDDDADERVGTIASLGDGSPLDDTNPDSDSAAWAQPGESLEVFNGEDPNGLWMLTVIPPGGVAAPDSARLVLSIETVPGVPEIPPAIQAGCAPASFGPFNGAVGLPAAIPDSSATCVSVSQVVAGLPSYLTDVNLTVNITHTFPGDIDFTLTSPSGTIVTISSDNGSSSDNVFAGTTFDDQANPAGQVPYTNNAAASAAPGLVGDHFYTLGVVSPLLAPEEPLAAFKGENGNGTWTLRACDDAGSDLGTINSWSLSFQALAAAPSLTTTSFSNNVAVAIPTGPAVVSSTIPVAVGGNQLANVRVTTNLTHLACADLDITLQSPTGKVATLTTDNGGTNDNVFSGTLWDNDASPAGQVQYANTPGVVGDHAYVNLATATPLAPEESFGLFDGDNPNGIWTLTISDDLSSNGGTLSSWTLEITTAECASCLVNADCNDGQNCTVDTCNTGTNTCVFTPVTCDDGNPCTIDACDPATGLCTFTNRADGSPCLDGIACNGAETCQNGVCTPGPAVVCNDNNPCTIDACMEPAGTCVFTPSSGACDDGNPCTTNDTCVPSSFAENFDGVTAPTLPAGWSATGSGAGAPWATVITAAHTVPNSAFTNDVATVGEQSLLTPSLHVASMPAQVTFQHRYQTESGFDGAVLEISVNGGAFTDILTAGGSFATGGYTGTISLNFSNPLAGRPAWTGTSAGFAAPGWVLTTVNLPASTAGQDIVLRVRMGTDTSASSTGFWVDTFNATLGSACVGVPINCDDGDPCTDDICVPGVGCTHPPTQCTDNNLCTADTCVAGVGCVFTTIVNCDDGDSCTLDFCDAATGTCFYEVNPACLGACCQPHEECDLLLAAECDAIGGFFNGMGSACPGPAVYDDPTPPTVAIPAAGNAPPSTIVVPAAEGVIITDVDVDLQIIHTFVGDLDITLTHGATTVDIWSDNCAGNDNLNVILSDGAPAPPATCGGLALATYSPDNPLSAFIGQNSAGPWILQIVDDAAGDQGLLEGWSLHFLPNFQGPPPCPGFGACCLPNDDCVITTEARCEDPVGQFQGTYQGDNTECTVPHSDQAGNPVPEVFVTNPNIPIPTTGTGPGPAAPSIISVPAFQGGIIADLDIDLRLLHTFVGDLDITLTHGATSIDLWSDNCGANDDLNVILSDGAPVAPGTCGGLTLATYAPDTALSAFNGQDSSGDWILTINDDAGGDSGVLQQWSLHVTTGVSICNDFAVCDAGGPYSGDCREATIDGATVTDAEGDAISYSWSSSSPDVTFSGGSGTVAAGAGPRSIPPATAVLSPFVDPTGQSYTITLSVEDVRGVSTCTAEVSFDDDVPPQVSCPADTTVECGTPTDPSATGTATASDNCQAANVTFVERQLGPFMGVNADVILNDGIGPMDVAQVTIDQDTVTAAAGFCFATQTGAMNLGCAPTANGLPDNGFFGVDFFHPSIQLSYDDNNNDGPNARQLTAINQSFTFAIPPDNFTQLHVIAVAGQNANTMRVSVTYTDTSTQVFPDTVVDDWFTDFAPTQDRYYVVDGLDRVRTNGPAGMAPVCQDSNDPAIFGYRFLPDPNRQVASITITRTTAGSAQSKLTFFTVVGIARESNPGSGISSLTHSDVRVDGDCPGNYTIERTWTAVDDFGNTSSCVQRITVQDTTPPVIDQVIPPGGGACNLVWPPQHGYVDYEMADVGSVSGHDDCSPVVARIVACESSQPENGLDGDPVGGDGDSTRDCVISPDGTRVSVRAERSGNCGIDRTYTVRLGLVDECGNVAVASTGTTICVFHDMNDAPDGPYRSANPDSNQDDTRPGTNGTYGTGCGTGCGCAP